MKTTNLAPFRFLIVTMVTMFTGGDTTSSAASRALSCFSIGGEGRFLKKTRMRHSLAESSVALSSFRVRAGQC